MAHIQVSNNYDSSLAVGISATTADTDIVVNSLVGAPSIDITGDYFMLTLVDSSGNLEIVKAIAVDSGSNTITVERAQENTTALAFPADSRVSHRFTAGSHEEFLQNWHFRNGNTYAYTDSTHFTVTGDMDDYEVNRAIRMIDDAGTYYDSYIVSVASQVVETQDAVPATLTMVELGPSVDWMPQLANAQTAQTALTADEADTITGKTIVEVSTGTSNLIPESTSTGKLDVSWVDDSDAMRQALGLEIGVDVQAYDSTLLTDSDIGVTVEAYDATLLREADFASQAEAEAGTDNTKVMTPLRTAQSIAALTTSSDILARNLAWAAFFLANDTAGTYGPATVDSFLADTLDVATGLTWNSGYYTSAVVGGEVDPATTTPTSDFTTRVSAWYDGNLNQNFAEASYTAAATAYAQYDFGAGNEKVITSGYAVSAASAGFAGAAGVTVNLYLEGSNNNADWTSLDTTSVTDDAVSPQTANFTVADSTPYRYVRCRIVPVGSTETYLGEFRVSAAGIASNITAQPISKTLDTSDPSSSEVLVIYDGTLTLGTDIICKFSLDGGSTFSSAGTWTSIGDFGNYKLAKCEIDTSGLTGSSALWQITTANTPDVELHEVGWVVSY